MVNWLLTALFASSAGFVACGDGSAPKPKKKQSSSAEQFGEPDPRVICDATRCERLELEASVPSGTLQGSVNQPLNWQISATTSPFSSSRELLIQASGGPAACNWAGSGVGSVSCSTQPNSEGQGQVTVEMLDSSYCKFLMNSQRANPNVCQSIESARSLNLVVTKQVSWTVSQQQSYGQFDPGQNALPPVQDQSMMYCALGGLPNLLGALSGNLMGGITGGLQGCLQGYMQGQQLKQQQEMMQQQMLYQQMNGQQFQNGLYPGP